jgi:hypothetical protein
MRPRNFSSETKIREIGFLHEVGDGTSLLGFPTTTVTFLSMRGLDKKWGLR